VAESVADRQSAKRGTAETDRRSSAATVRGIRTGAASTLDRKELFSALYQVQLQGFISSNSTLELPHSDNPKSPY
jgi:hypothetical protein